MATTKIEWADAVWNPVTGCTLVSEGCENCYARRMAYRLRGRYGYPSDKPFRVTLHPDRLQDPLHWEKPRRVFVCSMGDLFHEDVPYEFIEDVFEMMDVGGPLHTFLVLTKRVKRMADFISRLDWHTPDGRKYFPPNVWLGVTVETQARADERIPILLQTQAAGYFVSYEPGLGPVDLGPWLRPESKGAFYNRGGRGKVTQVVTRQEHLDWVIVGGETGPGARPMHPDWVRGLRDQCQAAKVPFFFKSWGDWCPFEEYSDFNARKLLIAWDGSTCPEYCGWGRDNYLKKYAEVVHVGRTAAGRLLDGRTWDEFPEVNNHE